MCNSDGKYSFSFMEMINSYSTGKTSATAVIGTVTCLVILLIFISLSVYFMFMEKNLENIEILKLKESGIMDIIDSCVIMFGMGSALLGVRNIAGVVGSKKHNNVINHVEATKQNIDQNQQLNS